ncbi:serine-rich adhesin for platelets-like [Bombus flavifrons]|uniref:serine-rich adhesin for platelets-like n=1 Tax=Bombus flavifrons TaxID=103934 RepID=UPI003704CF52
MPQILNHRKVKKSQKRVLVKRKHFLTNYHEAKSYKPLCKQLQSNNNSLARALSKEKHEGQLLFSQNVALIAEVQDLGLACNKRDAIISNILKNAKEMLKMLVTLTGYLTNTISSCQEFVESVATNMQMSYNSAGKRESLKGLSIKSPTRGVVKPMVSGYTITKPTINLSRLNMQHINNSSNLSIIPEVRTPPRNQELNNSMSPNGVSVRRTCKNGRTYRMPERLSPLTVASQRDSDESEQRLSERSSRNSTERMSGRISERMSGRISGRMSERLSGRISERISGRMSQRISERITKSKSRSPKNRSSRCIIENLERIGSPRVKLNDVSKLLQNSHTINIRMLTENQNSQETDRSRCSNEEDEDSQTKIIAETSTPNDSGNNNDGTTGDENEESNNELDTTDEQKKEKVNETKSVTSNWEDPLEGPSWLFDNSQVVPSFTNNDKKTDDVDVSNDDSISFVLTEKESKNLFEETMQEMSPLSMSSRCANHVSNSKNSIQANNEDECDIPQQNENNYYNGAIVRDANENECKTENASTTNLQNYITQRRGYFESDDEDDFTLIYTRQPRNMHFDINDLKLPVLEESALKPIIPAEPEPEITTTLRKISQICPIPSVSHDTLNESTFNQSTVNLPLLVNNDNETIELAPVKKESKLSQQKNKRQKVTTTHFNDFVDNTPPLKKNNSYKKKKGKPMKDPSAVKVVLQKLNESDVKSRTPSPNETISRDCNQSLSPISSRADNSSDSESSTSTNSTFTCNRPRRKRAQISYHEPNLIKKLRRNR